MIGFVLVIEIVYDGYFFSIRCLYGEIGVLLIIYFDDMVVQFFVSFVVFFCFEKIGVIVSEQIMSDDIRYIGVIGFLY